MLKVKLIAKGILMSKIVIITTFLIVSYLVYKYFKGMVNDNSDVELSTSIGKEMTPTQRKRVCANVVSDYYNDCETVILGVHFGVNKCQNEGEAYAEETVGGCNYE